VKQWFSLRNFALRTFSRKSPYCFSDWKRYISFACANSRNNPSFPQGEIKMAAHCGGNCLNRKLTFQLLVMKPLCTWVKTCKHVKSISCETSHSVGLCQLQYYRLVSIYVAAHLLYRAAMANRRPAAWFTPAPAKSQVWFDWWKFQYLLNGLLSS
jgi:hypothetical protein